MPLTQGTVLGYDVASMTFGFTMRDGQGRTIDCCISSAAMDELDERSKGKGTAPKDRISQFAFLRPRIEAVASAMFDEDKNGRVTVRIYYHHIWSRKYRTIVSSGAPDARPPGPKPPPLLNADSSRSPFGGKAGRDHR